MKKLYKTSAVLTAVAMSFGLVSLSANMNSAFAVNAPENSITSETPAPTLETNLSENKPSGVNSTTATNTNSTPNNTNTAPGGTSNAAPLNLVAGSANWNFVNSWRSYVSASNETLSEGASLVPGTKDIQWTAQPNQTFDPSNPDKLHFTGHAAWNKYGGFLDVHMKNITIDFRNKQLLVDVSTANTMAGTGPASATQGELVDLKDLKWEVRGNTLIIVSHTPIIKDLSERIVGFYKGDKGAPFLATFEIHTGDPDAPDRLLPVFWKLFPTQYDDPFYRPPLVDENEATVEVNVPDPMLRKCIFRTLDIPENTAIVNKVLQQLQSVTCINVAAKTDAEKIQDLTGLEHARNLSWLRLQYNAVSDLSPLQNLTKLHTIDVSHNKITSLEPLANVNSLLNITADNNKITSLEPLKDIPELNVVKVNNNRLTNVNGLPYRIKTFYAENNRIADISGLGFTTTPYLLDLNLRNNRLVEVNPLTSIEAIERVDLRDNFITNPCPLSVWASNSNLRTLKLQNNKFDDWTCLSSVPRTDVADPSWGEVNETNPNDLAEVLKADAAQDSREAEEANPVETNDAMTVAFMGVTQTSNSTENGSEGLTPAQMFANTPKGATYSLQGANTEGVVVIENTGTFTIAADGVVTFTPVPKFKGETKVTVVLTTLANNTYTAKYLVVVNVDPETLPKADISAPQVAVGDEVVITGRNFTPGAEVAGEIHSTPYSIGTQIADQNGTVTFRVTIPENFATGAHTVYLTETGGTNRAQVSLTVTPKVTAPTVQPPVPVVKPEVTKPEAAKPAIPAAKPAVAKPAAANQLANTGANTATFFAFAIVMFGVGAALRLRKSA